jgi:hypothetical protein
MKEPNAPGYIDRSRPHTINHIIVDDLGVDEVLLLATDSGNVTGYNVSRRIGFLHHWADDHFRLGAKELAGSTGNPYVNVVNLSCKE